jgi:hypothetical protein
MAITCSFRGVSLTAPTDEVQVMVDSLYRPSDVFGEQPDHYGGSSIPLFSYPTLPDLTLGVFRWPYRISAFASFSTVITQEAWTAIKSGTTGTDIVPNFPVDSAKDFPPPPPPTVPPLPAAVATSVYNGKLSGTFTLAQGENSISVTLYALRPKRLTPRDDSPLLLTLVDARYWIYRRAVEITQATDGKITVDRGTASSSVAWDFFVGSLLPSVGYSQSNLTVTEREHGKPNNQWFGEGVPTQLAIETIADSIGSRVYVPVAVGAGAGTEFHFKTWQQARVDFNTHFTPVTGEKSLHSVGGRLLDPGYLGVAETSRIYLGDDYSTTNGSAPAVIEKNETRYLPAKAHGSDQALPFLRYRWTLWRSLSAEYQAVYKTLSDSSGRIDGIVAGDPGPFCGGIEWGVTEDRAYTQYLAWPSDQPRIRSGGGGGSTYTAPVNELVIIGFVCDDSGYLIPNYDIRNAAVIPISGTVTNDGTPVSGVTITGSVNTPGDTLTSGTIATTGGDGKYSGVVSPYRVVNVTTGLNQFFVQATAGSSYTPNPAKISIVPASSSITQNFTV